MITGIRCLLFCWEEALKRNMISYFFLLNHMLTKLYRLRSNKFTLLCVKFASFFVLISCITCFFFFNFSQFNDLFFASLVSFCLYFFFRFRISFGCNNFRFVIKSHYMREYVQHTCSVIRTDLCCKLFSWISLIDSLRRKQTDMTDIISHYIGQVQVFLGLKTIIWVFGFRCLFAFC